ncbi:MAG TPA: PEP-CTERM sorting domain-containing protein [Candidatus Acidoferrales bacterium]|nr:PEP-CTERM sorting domain-containing protein [Candidatus Acidoferrales bacterium]
MKRMLLVALLGLAMPLVAFASNSIDFTNSGGTLTGSNAGLSLTGSELIAVNGLNNLGLVQGDLGTVTFSTGALISGSFQKGGQFAGGGSFIIQGNGTNGIPNGNIFNGSFAGPVKWCMVTLANGTHNYTLMGAISGTWLNGGTVNGAAVELTINTGKGFFNGSTSISSGDINVTVPEPSTLGLMGIGMVGLAGAIQRRRKA